MATAKDKIQNVSTKLKERWARLVSQSQSQTRQSHIIDTSANTELNWWDYIESHYTEKTRHYHSLQHVDTMLGLMDECVTKLSSPEAVAFAVFFHDVIYDPTASDNEEKSAEAFKEFSVKYLDDMTMAQDIYDWILLTKKHITPQHEDGSCSFGTEDQHYFLDMDMQVLGWPAVQYRVYADQIRKEYIHIPDRDYRTGRAKVLRKFLERPRIYATELFHQEYEEQARTNIKEEIKRLEGG